MSSISEWRPYERFVQGGLVDGRFASAAFTLIAAGPPRLANMGGAVAAQALLSAGQSNLAFPIGVVQNLNLAHNRAFARFWELGSERSYFISGRTMGQLALSRVMYHGPSLLRVLYAYYQDPPPTLGAIIPPLFPNAFLATVANPHDVIIPPGYLNIFLNLASDLFSQPIGLLLYFRDSNEDTLGAIYLESCYVPSHTLATDAGGTVIQEQAGIQFERAVPVAVSSKIGLITGEFNLASEF